MLTADYIVVGSGLTGAVIARLLSDAGREVLLLERRSEIGGNVHESVHETGIRFHTYGPHYFRTSSEKIWGFVNQFDKFRDFEARLVSFVDGEYVPWPIQSTFLERKIGNGWCPAFHGTPSNFEEASLAMMPDVIYRMLVQGYTEKQWGVSASALSVELAKRFDVRNNGDTRLSQHKFQGLPVSGYSAWMVALTRGIPRLLNYDYAIYRQEVHARRCLVFTGPIDEYFQYQYGHLRYRSQRRTHHFVPSAALLQPCVQVNYPSLSDGAKIRTIEWRHLEPSRDSNLTGTLITQEEPFDAGDSNQCEYPFPDEANLRRYQLYRAAADKHPSLLICGRLGEYRYLDMDQAIGRALKHASRLIA